MRFYICLFLCLAFSLPLNAAENTPLVKIKRTPKFELPIDCEIGKTCWIMNYVDMVPGDDKGTDLSCNNRSYDNHKGTDFAILDGEEMKRGVNVIAPRAGTVKKVRDEELDRWANTDELKAVQEARKECGNAVLIDHGSGLQTLYCHMKKGSIVVKPNQQVSVGDVLGQVGLSGFTQFPHLHFGVIWEGAVIDPFTGVVNTKDCGTVKHSLWDKDLDLTYEPFVIQSAGLTSQKPDFAVIEKNGATPDKISSGAPLLAFWTTLLGVRVGDVITLEVRDPNNKIFAQRQIAQEKVRARQFYYTGRRMSDKSLQEGAYLATVTVERPVEGGEPIQREMTKAVLVSN